MEWSGAGVSSRVPGAMDGYEHDRLLPPRHSPGACYLGVACVGIVILSLSYRPGAWQVSGGTRARTFRILPHGKSCSIAVTEIGGGGRVGSYSGAFSFLVQRPKPTSHVGSG
jgi:hypothetical protein